MSLQVQTIAKTKGGALKVVFNSPYPEPPVVILTPFWDNSTGSVGSVPTVTDVTTEGCTIVSNNAAATHYFINILTIDPSTIKIDGLMVAANMALKENTTVEVLYPNRFQSLNPVTLLTSFWKGSNGPVGSIDTLDDSSSIGCKIISGNRASNYYTNYLSIDIGLGDQEGTVFESGVHNKTGAGTQRVYFTYSFESEPTVLLSPWWNDANSQVGSIETVTKVTPDYFEFTSGNAAANYFVNWIAVLE